MSLKQDIQRWVKGYVREQQGWSLGLGVAALIAGFVALVITYWVIYSALFMKAGSLRGVDETHALTTWAILAGLFVLYLITDSRKLEKLDFESPDRQRRAWMAARVSGHSMLSLAAGPKTAMSFVKIIASVLLMGPLLTVTSLKMFWRAVQLYRLDQKLTAQALISLAKAGRKVSLDKFISDFPDVPPKHLLAQLQLIDGVIITSGDSPGVYVTDSLKADLADARNQS